MKLNQPTITAFPLMGQFIIFASIAYDASYNNIASIVSATALKWDNMVYVVFFIQLAFAIITASLLALVLFMYIVSSMLSSGVSRSSAICSCACIDFILIVLPPDAPHLSNTFFVFFMIFSYGYFILFAAFFSISGKVFPLSFTHFFGVFIIVTLLDYMTTLPTPAMMTIWVLFITMKFRQWFFNATFSTTFSRGIHSNHLLLAPNEVCSQSVGVTDFRPVGLDYIKNYSRLETF